MLRIHFISDRFKLRATFHPLNAASIYVAF